MTGGVVFRAGERLAFLPATIAVKVMPAPAIAKVPGGPPELRGVAFVDGDMIPIVAASEREGDAMLVCTVMGEAVGLVGVEVVATGRFAATEGGDVRHGAETARTFDIANLIAKVQRVRWGATLSE
ncbi:MAG: chemotaxis protein CheW [Labilithrix sp.]|nr:chemotaxis protein CheW [Labilithrix sp.]MCW5810553.1 chemotaxis protein CheW [Labilithrix sp.]